MHLAVMIIIFKLGTSGETILFKCKKLNHSIQYQNDLLMKFKQKYRIL